MPFVQCILTGVFFTEEDTWIFPENKSLALCLVLMQEKLVSLNVRGGFLGGYSSGKVRSTGFMPLGKKEGRFCRNCEGRPAENEMGR